jgi:hypothetical protein
MSTASETSNGLLRTKLLEITIIASQFFKFVEAELSPSRPANLLFRCFASGILSAARLFGSSPRRSPSDAINVACCRAILIHALSTPAPRLLLSIHLKFGSLIAKAAFKQNAIV